MATITEEVVTKAVLEDGVSKALKSISREMGRVGIATDQQRVAMVAMTAAAKQYGVTAQVVGIALKGLVRETQDAKVAAENLGTVLKFQTASGINDTEQAARQLGDALGGGTRALASLGGSAGRAAAQINRITDPAQRAALAMGLINQRVNQGPTLIDRWNNRAATMNVRLAGMGLGFITVERAMAGALAITVGLTAAFVRFVKQGIDLAIKRSKVASERFKQMAESEDALKAATGKVILESKLLNQQIDKQTARMGAGAKFVDKNAESLGDMATRTTKLWAAIMALNPALRQVTASLSGGLKVYDATVNTQKELEAVTRQNIAAGADFSGTISGMVGPMNAYIGVGNTAIDMLNRLTDAHKRERDARDGIIGGERKDAQRRKKEDTQLSEWQEGQEFRQDRGERPSARKARKGGGGGGGGGGVDADAARKRKVAGLLALAPTISLTDKLAIKNAERYDAALERTITTTGKLSGALDLKLWRLKGIGGQLRVVAENAKEAFKTQMIDQMATRITAFVSGPLNQMISGTYQLVDALATAQLTMSGLGVAAADVGGNIISNLGLDIVGKAMGEFAIRLGKLFAATGAAWQAFMSSPWTLAAGGALVIAAGLALKKYAGSGSVAAGGGGSVAGVDSSAASSVERFSQKFFGGQERDARDFSLFIADWAPMQGAIRSTTNDDARRGRTRTYGTAPAFGLG